jgi:fructose-bisphosphate aldolase class I
MEDTYAAYRRKELAMEENGLAQTARELVEPGKGILAADESDGTIKKRFDTIEVESTEETRRAYREMLFTTPGMEEHISGVILYDETIRQASADGTPFPKLLEEKSVIPGIKVDKGAKALAGSPDEKVTEGLDGLRERLNEYRDLGARFTKWRAVIEIGDGIPSYTCLHVNAHALGRYAALSQEAGLVPIVEPEVLMDGDHTIERCYAITEWMLKQTFQELYYQRIELEGMLLKPNMVVPGLAAADQSDVAAIAEATVTCLLRRVPAAVPGIAFLSGGQSAPLASTRLNAMNARWRARLPWALTFSFARAIQQPALEAWRGLAENVRAAQRALFHRADCNRAARRGDYDAAADAPRTA